jgi:hypothetical protein
MHCRSSLRRRAELHDMQRRCSGKSRAQKILNCKIVPVRWCQVTCTTGSASCAGLTRASTSLELAQNRKTSMAGTGPAMTTVETVPAVTAESGAHPQLAPLTLRTRAFRQAVCFACVAPVPRFRKDELVGECSANARYRTDPRRPMALLQLCQIRPPIASPACSASEFHFYKYPIAIGSGCALILKRKRAVYR